MAKLKVLSGKAVCMVLARHGFENVRQRGRHVVMKKMVESGSITVPVPMHDELKAGTLASIIRQSGLSRAAFFED
ncbi:MAG: hypothetical protein A2087_06715 [Spirochaetes bacterium GWD1_61_31]|nr:MAG: hypothetical protein A2Y37_08755 [Spirochaetes bacterium GWB1_60_80]OHD31861.1 MAG: hypothetical protein A2004_10140 [Spirochaetes bacterium GWC1_61_12]OHD40042.1 MAG: hypothetical protein A2087_06715 [Spirochaetes bacterium GWD1_61_31]OHD42304.1 MAG: hypothetical protein A2Y35_11285 [Spirochaetes bacterium GWE1_60_18]OHD58452.1 MAG: hypothetical protein A2Y32_06780 [Spirochaetes bacterium GWF1_60_12]HAP43998.1 hypothetical protein [Spirochaetaceae bacterium]